jgi:hypothetical protein
MDFLSGLVAKAGEGFQKAKSAVTGTPASVSDGYPTMGARRRRGKKTKKAGRRHRRKTGRRV